VLPVQERQKKEKTMSNSRRVSYFYDIEIGNYHYGQGTYRGY